MNVKYYLPDYVIILLDDDLISHLQYKKFKVASLLGPWIEYLSQFITEALQTRRQQLLVKARLREQTQVYWVEAVGHSNFDYPDQQVRDIFSKCLETNCKAKVFTQMRVLKLRDFWDKNDDALVMNNNFTKHAISMYWRSMDASFQFNLKKGRSSSFANVSGL